MEFKYAKIAIYTPVSHADIVHETLARCGAGHIGNYDSCSFSTKGVGRFRGLADSNPYVGKPGKVEEAEEERIETICTIEMVDTIIEKIKKVHPYEEPAIDVYPLLNK